MLFQTRAVLIATVAALAATMAQAECTTSRTGKKVCSNGSKVVVGDPATGTIKTAGGQASGQPEVRSVGNSTVAHGANGKTCIKTPGQTRCN